MGNNKFAIITKENLTRIAEAIRCRTNTSDSIALKDFETKISEIEPIAELDYYSGYNSTTLSFNFSGTPYNFFNSTLLRAPAWKTPLSGEDLKNVFSYCRMLKDIHNCEDWDVANCTTLYHTFEECNALPSEHFNYLSNWDTSNITDLDFTFAGCYKLDNVDFMKGWDLDNVTSFYYTFYGCSQIKTISSIGKPMWKSSTSSSVRVDDTFYACGNLETVDLSKWKNIKIRSVGGLFERCSKLKFVDIRGFLCSGNAMSWTNALYGVPKTVKIIVKDLQEKQWWQEKFPDYFNCFYTIEEWESPLLLFDYEKSIAVRSDNRARSYSFYFGGTSIKNNNVVLELNSSSSNVIFTNKIINYELNMASFDISYAGTTIDSNIKFSFTISTDESSITSDQISISVVDVSQASYSIEDIPGAAYNFEINSDGFYESTNKNLQDSAALCKIVAVSPFSAGTLKITYINSGESNYDYGMISNKNYLFQTSSTEDTSGVAYSFKGQSSLEEKVILYNQDLEPGDFFCIKYRKDNSVDNGNDSLQFKIETI